MRRRVMLAAATAALCAVAFAAGRAGYGEPAVIVAVSALVALGLLAVRRRRGPRYVKPFQLPPSPALFVGRDAEVDEAIRHVNAPHTGPSVVAVTGVAGVGKTALALVAAHRVASRYLDGHLFARLGGGTLPSSPSMPPGSVPDDEIAVLRSFVEALQKPNESMPREPQALIARYRHLTGGRRLLIVLDEVSPDREISWVTAVGPRCVVVLTANHRPPNVPPSCEVRLEPLTSAVARQILTIRLGRDLPVASTRAIEHVVGAAQGHPLALHIAATAIAQRPNWSLDRALRGVSIAPGGAVGNRLAAGAEPRPGLAALDIAYALMTGPERQAFVALGVLPSASFQPWMLRAALGVTEDERLTDEVAVRLTDRLVYAHLVERLSENDGGFPVFRTLDYVRHYAMDRLSGNEYSALASQVASAIEAAAVERQQAPRELLQDAFERLLDIGQLGLALATARAALAAAERLVVVPATAGLPDEEQRATIRRQAHAALALIYTELGDTENAWDFARRAAGQPDSSTDVAVRRCIGTLERRTQAFARAEQTLTDALVAATRQGDRYEQIRSLRELSIVYELSEKRTAAARCEDRLRSEMLQSEDDPRLRILSLWAYGSFLVTADRPAQAEPLLAEGHRLATVEGYQVWEAWIGELRARAMLDVQPPRPIEARQHALRSLEVFSGIRHRYGAAHCRLTIAHAFIADVHPEDAIPAFEEALETFGNCGDRWIEARAMVGLAGALVEKVPPRRHEALGLWAEAQRVFAQLGDSKSARDADEKEAKATAVYGLSNRRRWPLRRTGGSGRRGPRGGAAE